MWHSTWWQLHWLCRQWLAQHSTSTGWQLHAPPSSTANLTSSTSVSLKLPLGLDGDGCGCNAQAGLSLEIYGVGDGAPARSEAAAALRTSNLAGLHELLAQAIGSYKALPREVDMCSMFTLKDTASTGYKASLAIGSNCKIEVGCA